MPGNWGGMVSGLLIAAGLMGTYPARADGTLVGRWDLVTMAGAASADYSAANLIVREPASQSATFGCNIFAARTNIAPATSRFQAAPLATTARACLPRVDALELRYIEALRSTRYYRIEADRLTLESDDRAPLLTFVRAK